MARISTGMGTALVVNEVLFGPILAIALQSATMPQVQLGDIEVRLFYKGTGRLSDDILSRKRNFTFLNTIIGEGDAEDYADDLLVSVRMSAGKFGSPDENHHLVAIPVEIEAVDRNGKILGRRIHKDVLTSFEGSEHKVLWLNDVTCAGEVTITASFARQRKSAKLIMGCGE